MFPTGPFVTSWLRRLINPTVPLTSFSGRLWHILPWKKHPPRTIVPMVEHREGVHFFVNFCFLCFQKKVMFSTCWQGEEVKTCENILRYLDVTLSIYTSNPVAEIRRVQRCVCGWCVAKKWLHGSTTNCDGLKLRKSCWDALWINAEVYLFFASKDILFLPLNSTYLIYYLL